MNESLPDIPLILNCASLPLLKLSFYEEKIGSNHHITLKYTFCPKVQEDKKSFIENIS